MFRFRHQHRASLTQRAALCLLLLGLVIAPLMAALGDIHEATHAHASAHVHADATDAGDRQDGDSHDGLLHTLMHSGHCLNHLATFAPMTLLSPPAALSDARLGANTAACSQHAPGNLLRPPDRSLT